VLPSARRPTAPAGECAVLLASTGVPFSEQDLRSCAELAGAGPVAVLSIARLHGSAFGLPNPGLMPTRKDRERQRDIVADAVRVLERGGRRVDGQVVITRNPAKTIARAARRRGVHDVVLAAAPQSRVRRLLEGDPVAGVRRRLRSVAAVTARP
jgi:nucleotide-binding universal stress UspA family protein